MGRYLLTNENETAYCTVEFELIGDDFVNAKYSFSSFGVDEMDWDDFQRIINECDTWKEELYFLATHVTGNWCIDIVADDGNGKCIYIEYRGDNGACKDLGTLAECYDDCDECDTYCYSFKNDSPYEHKWDCPSYCRCQEVYGTDYDEYGGEEYDPLWDFRCQCTKINGRESLMKQLGVDSL